MARLDNIGHTITPPPYTEQAKWEDKRGVRYVDNGVPYLTTHQLAKEFDMFPETVFRWCRKWFGDLPKGRAGAGLGYRIPLEYRMVARAWLQTEDPRLREVVRRAIVADPKDWVVEVANLGTTCYSDVQTVATMERIIRTPQFKGQIVSTMYVGETE